MLISLDGGRRGIVEPSVINLNGEDYLTAQEACARLSVKPATLYAYVSRGILPSYRQGIRRRRLYKRHDVERLLRLRPSDAPGRAVADAPRDLPRAEDWIPFVN